MFSRIILIIYTNNWGREKKLYLLSDVRIFSWFTFVTPHVLLNVVLYLYEHLLSPFRHMYPNKVSDSSRVSYKLPLLQEIAFVMRNKLPTMDFVVKNIVNRYILSQIPLLLFLKFCWKLKFNKKIFNIWH